MAVELVAFVCEGPTCRDRWDSATPCQSVADGLNGGDPDQPICVISEICLGHCQQGPSVVTVPVPGAQAAIARWLRPDQSSPGARVHHPRSVLQATALIGAQLAVHSGTRTVEAATELPVAANRELA
jgi:hypothetical protein